MNDLLSNYHFHSDVNNGKQRHFLIGEKLKKLPKLRAGAGVIWAMPKIKGISFLGGPPLFTRKLYYF